MMRQNHEPQILDDSDDDFDPKTEDINQYCSIIGLDPIKEPDLLWIAKEGILAKLEPPWKAINQADVGLYYFNFETGDSMWEHPNDQYYRQKVKTEREKMKKKSKKVIKFIVKTFFEQFQLDIEIIEHGSKSFMSFESRLYLYNSCSRTLCD